MIEFWKNEEYSFLSNFYLVEIYLDGRVWASVEHYYQAQKSKDFEVQEKIRSAATAFKSKKLGRKIIPDSDWKYNKVSVMIRALVAKFSNIELQKKLLATGDQKIIENSPYDSYWGAGKENLGFNMLGRLLMLVRSHYQNQLNSPVGNISEVSAEGSFAALRKHDIHTGVDLYCSRGAAVKSIAKGKVHAVCNFTGVSVGSPWWNETQAIIVEHDFGWILYGEVSTQLTPGQVVEAGQELGFVEQVLIKDKGRPMNMLHLEWYLSPVVDGVVWGLEQSMPDPLLDPTEIVKLIK